MTFKLLTAQELKTRLESALPGSQAEFMDLTGTADHWQVMVVSSSFEGKPMIEQHRMVKKIFDADIQSGVVHALTIKTFTPAEWAARKR